MEGAIDFMRQRRKKGLILLVALVVGVMILPTAGFAAQKERPPLPVSGKEAKDPKAGSTVSFSGIGVFSTQYLKTWSSFINQPVAGEAKLNIGGSTSTYSAVDTVGLSLILQVYDESAGLWSNVRTLGTWEKIGGSGVSSGTLAVTVPGGFYYRVKGVHYAVENGSREEQTSYTNYLYIES